jgi:hypothetical protein
VDAAVAVHLGVVADALEQPIDDTRRAPTAPRDRPGRGGIDRDVEDRRRPIDDLGELVLGVEVEPIRGAEPVA